MLSGLVVALALIPEAVPFSIIAGVDPKVGLYASFSIAVIIAFAGGRRGMISAATGATALVLVPLVKDHGVEYVLATTILAGVVQVGLGALGVGRLMRFVPQTVMIGFVNALAILIFLAQVPHITGGRAAYVLLAVGLGIIYLMPRITKVVPGPLVAIVVVAGAAPPWDSPCRRSVTWGTCRTRYPCSASRRFRSAWPRSAHRPLRRHPGLRRAARVAADCAVA